MSNEITAYFKGRAGVSESLYQYDYGMVLNLDGIELPSSFECYFDTTGSDEAIPAIGTDGRVAIPNDCLSRPGDVTLHIPLHSGVNDSQVEYVVKFRVIGRARPVDGGTPEQQTAIEQALALLQNPITNIEQIVNEALAFTGDTFDEMQEQLDADQAAYESSMNNRATEFESGINTRQSEVESDFSTLNSQFNNLATNLTPNSKEVLYSGTVVLDGTITLSKNISNFDFIDIEYQQTGRGGGSDASITKRIPAVSGIYWVQDFAMDYASTQLQFFEQKLTLSGTSLVAESNYNIDATADSWVKNRGAYLFEIKRVLGIKMGSASPAELTDIRVGGDGATYATAGDAVRSQSRQLGLVKDQIVAIGGKLIPPEFEIGTRYVSNGQDAYNNNVKRMSFKRGTYLELKQGDVVTPNSAVLTYFGGGYSTNNGESFTGIETQVTSYTVPADGIYFFWLYKIGEADFTAADILKASSYITFTRNGSPLDRIETWLPPLETDGVLLGNAPLPYPEAAWIRYSNGERISSDATNMYVFYEPLPKYVKAFLASDTDALCAIAFFNSKTISTSSYMKSASIDFASGVHNDGLWYETEVPADCKAMAIVSKKPSASVSDAIIKFDTSSNIVAKIEDVAYVNLPLGNNKINGWIRHGTGELVPSSATGCYVMKNTGISKLRVFTKSDTTVIDAVSFYSGDAISTDTYLQSSVAWAGIRAEGQWYDVEVPVGVGLIAVSVVNASGTYSPQILYALKDILNVTDARYASQNQIEASLQKINDVILSGGWKYIYHFGMTPIVYRDVDVEIPSQSVFDIRNAYNLGFKCIEANVHKTSDGKYVVTHGVNGGLGHDFDDLNGDDAYGVSISQNTLAVLRENYRYRSTNPDYRVSITTLEEFCHEAKRLNMIVMFQYKDAAEIEIIKGIMGNRFFMYVANRSDYDGPILEYMSYSTKADILARCKAVGRPYIYSMGNTSDFTDEELQDIIDTLHQNGYYLATAYCGGDRLQKLSAMGFDFFAVDRGDVPREVVLDGKKLIFNENGTVTWEAASLG